MLTVVFPAPDRPRILNNNKNTYYKHRNKFRQIIVHVLLLVWKTQSDRHQHQCLLEILTCNISQVPFTQTIGIGRVRHKVKCAFKRRWKSLALNTAAAYRGSRYSPMLLLVVATTWANLIQKTNTDLRCYNCIRRERFHRSGFQSTNKWDQTKSHTVLTRWRHNKTQTHTHSSGTPLIRVC